jgi:hypothetical protein
VVAMVIAGAILLVPMPQRWTDRINNEKVRKRLQDRRRLLPIYWWLVAGVVLVTAVVLTEGSLVDPFTKRSEDFYKAALWPGVVLILLLVFGRTMLRMLRDATVESISVGTSGVSMEFTTDDVRGTLGELMKELADPVTGLNKEDKKLFKQIFEDDGTKTVLELCPDFKRGTKELPNEAHGRLRKLRGLNLIRPVEGGRWYEHKRPLVTRFGRLVAPQIDRLPSAGGKEP